MSASKNYKDYHTGGSQMPGRSFNPNSYRYGAADGQEKVDEVSGTGNHYTAEYWEYDPRLVRRWNVDPIVKYNESSYAAFSNNPIWLTDPNGRDTLVFGANNKYSNTIKADGTNVGMKVGEKGKFLFQFVDPVNDPKSIEKGEINELYFAKNATILKDLERAGVNKEENKGLIDGPLYLKNHSHSGDNGGETDFTITSEIFGTYTVGGDKYGNGLPGKYLYITMVNSVMIAQNNFNFGNFMWGASANALGVNLELTLLGAHANNYLNDSRNYGKKWYERKFDSADDQRSIFSGWMWRANQKSK